jgi:hypothetical protein
LPLQLGVHEVQVPALHVPPFILQSAHCDPLKPQAASVGVGKQVVPEQQPMQPFVVQ